MGDNVKKEVNRYTVNLVIDGKYIAIGQSNLENIDRLSSNFEDKYDLINFIEAYADVEVLTDDIVVTYNVDKHTRELEMVYKKARGVIADTKLLGKLNNFLNKYSNVSKLNLDNLHNRYLKNLLYDMLEQRTVNDYDFRLRKLNERLTTEYKLKRDLALFIDGELTRRGMVFFNRDVAFEADQDEVIECMSKISMTYKPIHPLVMEPPKNIEFIETGDAFLDQLIADKDYDTISRMYDHEALEALGVRNIFDGTHEVNERGKSR